MRLLFLVLEAGFCWGNVQSPDGENGKEEYRSTYWANLSHEIFFSVISISIRTLDTSCYLLHVFLVDTNNLACLTILFWPRIVPNQKPHYFMELENCKRPWRLKKKTFILQIRKRRASKSKSVNLFIVGPESPECYKVTKQD